MTTPVDLIITHLGAFLAGAFAMRVLTALFVKEIQETPVDTSESQHILPPPGYHGWRWLAVGLILIVLSVLSLVNTLQLRQQQDCFAEYITAIQPYTQARDDAQQRIVNDFAAFKQVDPTDKAAVAELRGKFFSDVDRERAAAKALATFRAMHSPARHC